MGPGIGVGVGGIAGACSVGDGGGLGISLVGSAMFLLSQHISRLSTPYEVSGFNSLKLCLELSLFIK